MISRIPRVRLLYIHGLAPLHDELQAPREVDLSTNGSFLVVCAPVTGRPLARLPIGALEPPQAQPRQALTSIPDRLTADFLGTDRMIVLKVGSGSGAPPAVAGQPLVFADPKRPDVASTLGAIQNLLTPRTEEEMTRLAKGERRLSVYYTAVVLSVVVLVGAVTLGILLYMFGPRPRNSAPPATSLVEAADTPLPQSMRAFSSLPGPSQPAPAGV